MRKLPETPFTLKRGVESAIALAAIPLSGFQEYTLEPLIAHRVNPNTLNPFLYSLAFNSGDVWNAAMLSILSGLFLTPRFSRLSPFQQSAVNFSLSAGIVIAGETIPNHIMGNYADIHDIPWGLIGAACGTLLHHWANSPTKRR